MKYCSDCGGKVSKKYPPSDNSFRFVCDSCDKIHYQNPTVITGCLSEWEGQVLLCKRAVEPKVGTWTIPAGFMENGETVERAAVREVYEETGASISIDSIYSVFDVEYINQVYIVYRGKMDKPDFKAGDESLEVRLFKPEEIPWDNIFYPAIADVIKRYCEEVKTRKFGIYMGSSVGGKVAMIDSERIY